MTQADLRPDSIKVRAGFPVLLTLIALLLFSGFIALGVWQVERLAWKKDLIARVNARIDAAPIPAPRRANRSDEYRRISVQGRFLHDATTLTQASTVRGAGYWVMTPLRRDDGIIVMINRGFVPSQARNHYDRPDDRVSITGLLRLTEPGGGFLRSNDPLADRWYSRDVVAIAAARRLAPMAASYFIDAQAGPDPDALPAGGLTVIRFPNNHLGYALTWFVLAAMVAGAYIMVMRHRSTHQRT